ncbi:MAG TPA: membrane protein insertion efficiency factor YidD [Solirubrobacterales bacterium]|nr:membrane protein insertion efficiency factor YidD [Solirubrobacterales bacterium]
MKRLVTALLIAPLRLYQRWISPAIAPRCRYYPTCSAYAVEAIRELGPIRGLILAGWRLLRCNPFSHGGVDELSDRRLFRNTPTRSERRDHQHPPPGVPPGDGSSRPHLT